MKYLIHMLLVVVTVAASAQTVTISGSLLSDSQGKLATGTLTWRPTLADGTPTGYHKGGGGQATNVPIQTPVNKGVFSLSLPDTALTNPAHVCFALTFSNASGASLGPGYSCIQPESDNYWCVAGVCNLDNFNPNLASLAVVPVQPPGPLNPAAGTSSTITMMSTLLSDSIGELATGMLTLRPALNDGTSVAYRKGGGGQSTSAPIQIPVNHGIFSVRLPDTAYTSPQHLCFSATFSNAKGASLGPGYDCLQPTANNFWCTDGVCDFDSFVPNLASLGVVVTGPPGPQGSKGDTGATGATGANGASGPNQVSSSTATPLTGLFKGAGGYVTQAAADVDYTTPSGLAAAIAGMSTSGTGLADPGSNGVIYRTSLNTTAIATSTQIQAAIGTGVYQASGSYAQSSQLPATLATAAHKWLSSYNAATETFTQTQPDYSDLTGTPTLGTAASHAATDFDASGAAAARAATGICTAGQYGTATTASGLTCAQVAYAQVSGTPTLPTFPTGTIVGTTDTQTLTNKTIDGVAPATFAFIDPTSSIQAQINGKQASGNYALNTQLPATLASASHKWLNSYSSTTETFTQAQPTCGDLSDAGTGCSASVGTAATHAATDFDASGSAAARAAVGNCTTGQYGTATTTSGITCAQVTYAQVSGTPTLPTFPTGTIVGTSDTQALTNKTIDSVAPATMAYLDATSSVQAQINGKVGTSTTVNGHALSSNVVVSASDLTTGTLPASTEPAHTGDVTNMAGSLATTVNGLKTVPFCTGFAPSNLQYLQYTTASSPNPCYTSSSPSGSGTVTNTGGTLTSSYAVLGNGGSDTKPSTALSDSGTTMTYSGTGGINLSGAGAIAKVGSTAPSPTVGTAGGGVAAEGTSYTGVSGTDGWYANSSSHCFDIVNQTADMGCVATVNSAYKTSAAITNATTTPATTGIVLPAVPANMTVHGECILLWQSSSTSGRVIFSINLSAATTDLYVAAQTLSTAAASTVTIITASGTTAITGSLVPSAANTTYPTRITFTLQNGSSAETLTPYYASSSTSYTAAFEPGSYCTWLP